VAAKFLAALDAAPGDAGCDAASAASVPATPMIVGPVGRRAGEQQHWHTVVAGQAENQGRKQGDDRDI
jgi:hypothetical protein